MKSGQELIRSAGLRATAPRLAVLEVLADRRRATTEEVRCEVVKRLGSVSTQAVYDVLNALTSAGLLRRLQAGAAPARYELADRPGHDHLVCRACGDVIDVEGNLPEKQWPTRAQESGFKIDEAQVIYWGTCSACAAS